MTLEEIQSHVKNELIAVEEMIQKTLLQIQNEEAQHWMKYFCSSTGHRLRPMLTVIAYRSFKSAQTPVEYESLIKLATIFELLHTASLIHDDVIDLEEERRGQKALHHLVGNKNAILIGNIFYLKAFEIASELPNLSYFQEMISTSMAMCFGEVTQGIRVQEGVKLNCVEYLEVVLNKTSKLIASCCYCGARLAGASEEEALRLHKIGVMLGTLYQMRDDIKDGDANVDESVNLMEIYLKIQAEFKVLIVEFQRSNQFVKMLEAFFTIITKNIK